MNVVFFCQNCGARFDVPAETAGKKGRCRKCGQHMQIPRAEHLVSMASIPALASVGAGASPPQSRRVDPAPSISNWLRAAATNVGLAPITIEQIPALRRRQAASDLDDLGDSKPYALAREVEPQRHSRGGGAPGFVLLTWRREMGHVQKMFRTIHSIAYLISIPFLVLLLVGIATNARSLALFAATFVVVLNLAQFVAGVGNLLAVPLRDGVNTRKMKKPLRRVVEPVLVVAGVLLAFTFIPWLASPRSAKGTLADRIKAEAQELNGEMKDELKRTAEKATKLDVKELGDQAKEKLKSLREIGNDEAPPEGNGKTQPGSPEAAIDNLIKSTGKRASDSVDEAQKP